MHVYVYIYIKCVSVCWCDIYICKALPPGPRVYTPTTHPFAARGACKRVSVSVCAHECVPRCCSVKRVCNVWCSAASSSIVV